MGIGNLDFDPEDPVDPVLPAFGSKSRISDVGMTELDWRREKVPKPSPLALYVAPRLSFNALVRQSTVRGSLCVEILFFNSFELDYSVANLDYFWSWKICLFVIIKGSELDIL